MKKLIVTLLCIAMGISLVGCNIIQSALEQGVSSEVSEEKEDLSEEESENTMKESEEVISEKEKASSSEVMKEEETPINYTRVSIGETVTVADKYEFCIESIDYVSEVLPAQPGQFHLKYSAEPGRAFIDCVFLFKNLSAEELAGNRIVDGLVKYADKYVYDNAKSVLEEDDRSDFMFAISETLPTGDSHYMHCYFEVPEEVVASNGKVEVVLTFGEDTYGLVAREGNDADELGIKPSGTASENGTIEVGGVYATEKAEFGIEYAEFKQKVEPPNPGSFYSFYEAEAGMTYLDICIPYKNYGKEKIVASDVFAATMIHDNSTTYEGSTIVESQNRTDLTYSGITDMNPLIQGYIHMLFEVPQDVAESGSVQVIFKMEENEYILTVR